MDKPLLQRELYLRIQTSKSTGQSQDCGERLNAISLDSCVRKLGVDAAHDGLQLVKLGPQ